MSRGYPDWGINTEAFAQHETDFGEVATRLESSDTYDQKGKVVHIDKCIYGTQTWEVGLFGVGAAVALDTAVAFRHEKSLKLTSGSDSVLLASISKQIPFLSESKVGAEFTWALTGIPRTMEVQVAYFDGTNLNDFRCSLSFNLLFARYLNSAGSFVSHTAIVDLRDKPAYWHTFKLVVDLISLEYVKFMYDNVTLDLSSLGGEISASTAPAHLQAQINVWGDSGENRYANVNDFIFTVDEP